jgi:hypothetical protein
VGVKRTGGTGARDEHPLYFAAGHADRPAALAERRQTGGTFTPGDRPVYFAAGVNWTGKVVRWPEHGLVAVNELWTEKAEEMGLRIHLDAGRKILLDSGIFWLTNEHKRAHKITMDEALSLAPEEIDGFDKLYLRYVTLVQRYGDRLWGFVELDQGGAVNKRRTRAGLENLGIIPMPVYHPLNDGWDYFTELAEGYDRICFGNIVQASRALRVRLLHMLWERRRDYPHLWVHVLGLSAGPSTFSLPVDSCDVSTWLSPLRWPAVRTESAMLSKIGDLGPGFAYDLNNPHAENATRMDSFGMCSDAMTAASMNWRHAAHRITEITGPAYPARMDREAAPSRPTGEEHDANPV